MGDMESPYLHHELLIYGFKMMNSSDHDEYLPICASTYLGYLMVCVHIHHSVYYVLSILPYSMYMHYYTHNV